MALCDWNMCFIFLYLDGKALRMMLVYLIIFAILRHMPKFKIETQVQIVCATMAIHNFIRRHSKTDTEFNQYEHTNIFDGEYNSYVGESSDQTLTISSFAEMDRIRDSIRDQIINHMQ
ncbi:hypothetical protein AHAS_Ahas18G0244600 [Arachis hypogaea]